MHHWDICPQCNLLTTAFRNVCAINSNATYDLPQYIISQHTSILPGIGLLSPLCFGNTTITAREAATSVIASAPCMTGYEWPTHIDLKHRSLIEELPSYVQAFDVLELAMILQVMTAGYKLNPIGVPAELDYTKSALLEVITKGLLKGYVFAFNDAKPKPKANQSDLGPMYTELGPLDAPFLCQHNLVKDGDSTYVNTAGYTSGIFQLIKPDGRRYLVKYLGGKDKTSSSINELFGIHGGVNADIGDTVIFSYIAISFGGRYLGPNMHQQPDSTVLMGIQAQQHFVYFSVGDSYWWPVQPIVAKIYAPVIQTK